MHKNALGAPLALFGVPLSTGASIRMPRFSARPMSVRLRVASSVGSSVVVSPLSAGWIARLEIDYVFGLVGQARRAVLHPRNYMSGSVLLVQSALDSLLPLRLRSSPDKVVDPRRVYSPCPGISSAAGIARRMKAPNIGTVKAVSP